MLAPAAALVLGLASPPSPGAARRATQRQEGWFVDYFAIGSNLNSEVLVGRRRISPLAARPAVARGYRCRLGSNSAAAWRRPGGCPAAVSRYLGRTVVAGSASHCRAARPSLASHHSNLATRALTRLAGPNDARPAPAMAYLWRVPMGSTDECHGVVYSLTPTAWLALCASEGVPLGYSVV